VIVSGILDPTPGDVHGRGDVRSLPPIVKCRVVSLLGQLDIMFVDAAQGSAIRCSLFIPDFHVLGLLFGLFFLLFFGLSCQENFLVVWGLEWRPTIILKI